MKNKFFTLIIFVLSFAMVLSGCSLFELNVDKYLKETVASIDDEIYITKEDLIIAFNNYGETLISNYNYTTESAVEYLIDMLVNREILLREAKRQFGDLTNIENSNLWKDTYDQVNENLKEYEGVVKASWDILSDEPTQSEEESSITFYEPYEKLAEIVEVDGVLTIRIIELSDEDEGGEVIEGGAENFVQEISREDISREAKKRYIKALKESEEGKIFEGENAYSDTAIWNREINRIYDLLVENFYLNKLEEFYSTGTDITVRNVLDEYKSLLLSDYVKYSLNATQFDTDMKDTDANTFVYYVPNSSQVDNYFYVSQILVSFDDDQKEMLANLKTQLANSSISEAAYNLAVADLAKLAKTNKIVDGVKTDEVCYAEDILASLSTQITGKSDLEQAEIFNNYIYMFNSDSGIFNAEVPYVVGETTSSMVESFTEASRELNDTAEIGAVSGLVISDYGVHIIFYAGKALNQFEIANPNAFDLSDEDILVMDEMLLNICNNKTMFDKVYESLVEDNYSTFEALFLNQLKQNTDIKIYKNAYKDLID